MRLGFSAWPWCLALLLASLLVACGDSDDIQVLTDDEIGTEIELSANELFEIHLESNPTTGYAWGMSAMTTPDLVSMESKTYVGPDSDLVGVAGTDIFVFTAGGQGSGILRLEYVRSFEDPAIPERVAEFIIRIEGVEWPPPQGTVPPTSTAEASE